jgi:hypothetical protein
LASLGFLDIKLSTSEEVNSTVLSVPGIVYLYLGLFPANFLDVNAATFD